MGPLLKNRRQPSALALSVTQRAPMQSAEWTEIPP